jgi:hypothetical protein
MIYKFQNQAKSLSENGCIKDTKFTDKELFLTAGQAWKSSLNNSDFPEQF